MSALLSGLLGPMIGVIIALIAAWKAAELLEADNHLMAVAVGAALAILGPLVVGDLITGVFAEMESPGDGASSLSSFTPKIGLAGSRLGFALIGVLLWCGVERRR